MRALLASLLILISAVSYAQTFGISDRSLPGAKAATEFLSVEQAYQLEVEIIDELNVRVYWQIAPDYYLYQHRFRLWYRRQQRQHRPPKHAARGAESY